MLNGIECAIYDTQKMAQYLFYAPKDSRLCFIGCEEDYDNFKYGKPDFTAKLISPEMVENWYPRTFAQKIDYILEYLYDHSKAAGDKIKFDLKDICNLFFIVDDVSKETIQSHTYEQYNYYVKYLDEKGYVECTCNAPYNYQTNCFHPEMSLLPAGLGIIEDNARQMINNKNAFVAMSFKPEANDLRETIKKGILDAGFIPILMDEQEYNQQIVPEMLRQIQDCKFMVADFSDGNRGSYYEAGYAAALKKEVIHTCSTTAMKDELHFDVKQVNTIEYDEADLSKLSESLTKRIKATIL